MTVVNIHEAKTHLSQLLRRVISGEEIIIAKAGQPIAVLSPIHKQATPRIPDRDKGRVIVHDDFDDPLPEFDI